MAISANLYHLLRELPIPRGSTLLEIGEANWYGDLDPQSVGLERLPNSFEIAKQCYRQLFAPEKTVAIDRSGSPSALRLDLNGPIDLGEQFDVVINHGTAEHVLNIAQVFRTIHDHCELGGLMIHDAPFTGWVDHGFYCLQPTLFYDLARGNCYEIMRVAVHEIKSRTVLPLRDREHVGRLCAAGQLPDNANLFVVLRKIVERPFVVPMQGYYARELSAAGNRAWEGMR